MSTRNARRSGALRLLVVLAGEDDPKACTGRRLLRWGRVAQVARETPGLPAPVVLDPYAPTPLSSADLETAEAGGLIVVDCSWNLLSSRGAFPGEGRKDRRHGKRRRLPILVATNPQHYGRVAQLNTVEAFCAALYILGRTEEAQALIAGFSGGDQFLTVNGERLLRYRDSVGPSEVITAEKALFGGT